MDKPIYDFPDPYPQPMTQEQRHFIRELGPYSRQAIYENREVEFNEKVFHIWIRRWPNTFPHALDHERNGAIEKTLRQRILLDLFWSRFLTSNVVAAYHWHFYLALLWYEELEHFYAAILEDITPTSLQNQTQPHCRIRCSPSADQ